MQGDTPIYSKSDGNVQMIYFGMFLAYDFVWNFFFFWGGGLQDLFGLFLASGKYNVPVLTKALFSGVVLNHGNSFGFELWLNSFAHPHHFHKLSKICQGLFTHQINIWCRFL